MPSESWPRPENLPTFQPSPFLPLFCLLSPIRPLYKNPIAKRSGRFHHSLPATQVTMSRMTDPSFPYRRFSEEPFPLPLNRLYNYTNIVIKQNSSATLLLPFPCREIPFLFGSFSVRIPGRFLSLSGAILPKPILSSYEPSGFLFPVRRDGTSCLRYPASGLVRGEQGVGQEPGEVMEYRLPFLHRFFPEDVVK